MSKHLFLLLASTMFVLSNCIMITPQSTTTVEEPATVNSGTSVPTAKNIAVPTDTPTPEAPPLEVLQDFMAKLHYHDARLKAFEVIFIKGLVGKPEGNELLTDDGQQLMSSVISDIETMELPDNALAMNAHKALLAKAETLYDILINPDNSHLGPGAISISQMNDFDTVSDGYVKAQDSLGMTDKFCEWGLYVAEANQWLEENDAPIRVCASE